ncbi:Sodium/calcium exchanger protein-domain-containing protein [Apiospora kogelbergensis]|uniref:Sodium/calcium exchanger protein-domain-containing protein n=1 Tax=Apiospora kogelbergensis TaxID=1337665 RepID=A0AAW0QRF6_9PEZI
MHRPRVLSDRGARATRFARCTSRPFYITVLIITLLAVYSLFVRGPAPSRQHASSALTKRSGEDCRLVHHAADQCAFVRRNCMDDEAGLISYLSFYYCTLGRAQPVAFVILVAWLGLLFTTIGIAASDFFSVNLSTIATVLGLSESLAGVTFLAFGNGSPDVFSTFAAMSSNSGSMAVGELIGAAGFITAVVAGSMALVCEFKVSKKTFIRDLGFFIVAVAFAVGFLHDGHLHLWECCTMIGYYVFYVIVVVGWHTVSKRKAARRLRSGSSQGLVVDGSAADQGSRILESYRDGLDHLHPRRSKPTSFDGAMLEAGPRIELDNPDDDEDDDSDANSDVTSDHRQQIAVEMAAEMRVSRPRGRRTTTTITPIRPSLIGALEFRSALSTFEEVDAIRPSVYKRSHSTDWLMHTRAGSHDHTARANGGAPNPQGLAPADATATRARSRSSGAIPSTLDDDLAQAPPRPAKNLGGARSPSVRTVGGKLAPPQTDSTGHLAVQEPSADGGPHRARPQGLQLRIPVPSPPGSEHSSPATSPFPHYTESPMILSPTNPPETLLLLPSPAVEPNPFSPAFMPKPNRKQGSWWPRTVLPSPHVLMSTLFPTLQGWRSKSALDKFMSLISVPSIFLLVITLPVVENEVTDGDSDPSMVEHPAPGLGNAPAPVCHEPDGCIESETEWQRYRRHTRSRSASRPASPGPMVILATPDYGTVSGSGRGIEPQYEPFYKADAEFGPDDSTLNSDDGGWSRWLLIVQIFTGPLFAVCIICANAAEDLEDPIRVFVKSILGSLVFSLVLLAMLLVTTSYETRPKYNYLFCYMGFIIAVAWISTIAGEVVGVLKTIGVVLDISEAILGLTVFAVGNSVGDLVADITVARLGYPVMALSACFGGPLLNILLGIGLGGAYQTIHAANHHHHKHPDRPVHYKAYTIEVTPTLMISAVVLLITLLVLLVVVPLNKWIMDRKIGYGLIGLWTVGTVANLVIEMTGFWGDES